MAGAKISETMVNATSENMEVTKISETIDLSKMTETNNVSKICETNDVSKISGTVDVPTISETMDASKISETTDVSKNNPTMEVTKIKETKRKLNTLSLADKVRLISEIDRGIIKKKDLAAIFGIPPSTLSTIAKKRDFILNKAASGVLSNCKRFKTCHYEDIDKATLEWFKIARERNVPITGPLIRGKALHFAEALGHPHFIASVGWLDKFKKRHNIVQMSGESSVVHEHDFKAWRNNILPELLAPYDEKDVFNADETALFFKCLPDKTITFKDEKCSDGKLSEERITVMVGANMCGTEKLKPLVIGKSKRPHCLKGKHFLPVIYRSNKKAWMTSELFEEWLSCLDEKFCTEGRRILLFIDSCPSHPKIITRQLHAIQIVLLPPNMATALQPMNQGIIKNIKVHYRTRILRKTLVARQDDNQADEITLWDAITNLAKAWHLDVQPVTIKNCFAKAGFKTQVESNCGEEDDLIPLSVLKSTFDIYNQQIGGNLVSLDEYLHVDDDVIVTDYPSDDDILNKVKKVSDDDDDEADVGISDNEMIPTMPIPPSNSEMRYLLSKFSQYLCSKDTVTDEVYRALATLENFVDKEFLYV